VISRTSSARWAAFVVAAIQASATIAGPAEPTDPNANVPEVEYRAVLRDYRAPVIVEKPADWKALNERAEQIGGPGGQLKSPDQPIRGRAQ
jgi:hypothetical protein